MNPLPRGLVSRLASEAECSDEAFLHYCELLKDEPRKHRKLWEYRFILEAFDAWCGWDRPEGPLRGLGFGVGTEPLTDAFASLGCEVVATDLSQEQAAGIGWIETDQHASSLEVLHKREISSPTTFRQNVSFRAVDMNRIPDDLLRGEFDFVWSSCAFEHIGSLLHGLVFVANAMDCLRPGGVAIHTTEFNLSSNDRTVESRDLSLYRRRDIESLVSLLRRAGHRIEVDFSRGDGELDRYVDLPPYTQDRHIALNVLGHTTTSIGLVVIKDGLEEISSE